MGSTAVSVLEGLNIFTKTQKKIGSVVAVGVGGVTLPGLGTLGQEWNSFLRQTGARSHSPSPS